MKFAISIFLYFFSTLTLSHGIVGTDQQFLINNVGISIVPYIYLGAKHMVTGYDHLLFLAGVIFFLYRLKDIAIFVTLFAIGHSITLLTGVLAGLHINPYIIDTIIGFSVVYKAFENMGGFKNLKYSPNIKLAVLFFGLFHGFGLATKLQDFAISDDGLIVNMISFNIGVEIGQLIALTFMLLAFKIWRASGYFLRQSFMCNFFILMCGFVLMGYQITGYLVS
ncbi:MAG: HupE/UreJ family protein [Pseudomonadota bacterium]|nr:HupE/UreJ family protein [Pseudomonadota bacterium]|tara:strand:- start:5195 stop:5863 length:669 start_codon:yes stop_codon:yes gene_type:complete